MTALPPAVRTRVAMGLTAAAAVGRFELQVCRRCGAVQYPPREACHQCLSSALDWRVQAGGGELLSETTLLHSNDEFYRARLPIRLGLVRLDAGPTAVVFLNDDVASAPARVKVTSRLDRAGRAVLVASADVREGGMTQGVLLREMTCDPRGRRVFVTDAGSALGVALVRALLEVGAAVVWAGRTPSAAMGEELNNLLAVNNRVRLIDVDITSDESIRAAADQIASKVDILINNAESPKAASAHDDVDSARAELDVNYYGLVRLARAFDPPMRATATGTAVATGGASNTAASAAAAAVTAAAAAGISGATALTATGAAVGTPMMAWVNLLSIYALSALPPRSAFSASKAAAFSFAQSLRAEMSQAGIRVVNVFPGPIDDEGKREVLPPKMAPAALAHAMVKALQDGVEDVYPGEVAQDWYTVEQQPRGIGTADR
jgi:NAD(P)-dependent dehydrogenase (short-subunit alcohol dehydrogenase family)/uncharacterized OB-fold protein